MLTPIQSGPKRKELASALRKKAAELSLSLSTETQRGNKDLENFLSTATATFTKGLPHDEDGFADPEALLKFIDWLNQKGRKSFDYADSQGLGLLTGECQVAPEQWRGWESPLSGHVYNLIGVDTDAIAMPPAPVFGSGELIAEMAEVYALALLRDVRFRDISSGNGKASTINAAVRGLPWFRTPHALVATEARRVARLENESDVDGPTDQVLYRGSTPGAKAGPYISQFLLIGSSTGEPPQVENGSDISTQPLQLQTTRKVFRLREADDGGGQTVVQDSLWPKNGLILYGVQQIDQRVFPHPVSRSATKRGTERPLTHDNVTNDYMTHWDDWLAVQRGANRKKLDAANSAARFIATPRDLATYVHFDALYQAYLNACLLLQSYGQPADRGLPEPNCRSRDAFATFGGPDILSLVTAVASEALKFARRQKFNIHLRARPEAIAGKLSGYHSNPAPYSTSGDNECFSDSADKMIDQLQPLLEKVADHNKRINNGIEYGSHQTNADYLLPMAFPEGSPMHPSYAAGHATVAGACVTVLKAFFEMFEGEESSLKVTDKWKELPLFSIYGENVKEREKKLGEVFRSGLYEPSADPSQVDLHQIDEEPNEDITILGELDKLAANISIGRDMAGVHYYTDYYESLRMGERVAVGILRERVLTFPEKVEMHIKTFDGENMIIRGLGDGSTVKVDIANSGDGSLTKFEEWFHRPELAQSQDS